MKTRNLILAAALLFNSFLTFAAGSPTFSAPVQNLLNNTIRPLFPIIVALVFMVVCLFHLGDLFGEQKNFKRFGSNVLIYVGGVLLIGVTFNWLLSQGI